MSKRAVFSRLKSAGFSLMELVVTVAIVGILASVAYPAYTDFIIKSRRSDGQGALLDLATRLEKYLYQNGTYVGASVTGLRGAVTTADGFYTVAITASDATSYTLSAAPVFPQSKDLKCKTLVLASSGSKTAADSAECLGTGNCEEMCW